MSDSIYFIGNPCKKGHGTKRYVSNGACVECVKIKSARNSKSGQEKRKLLYKNNEEYRLNVINKAKEYNKINKEKVLASIKIWQEKNKDHVSAYKKQYALLNKNRFRAYCRNRRALMRNANGSHSHEEIELLLTKQKYKCAICSCNIREVHHADHIEPLSKGGSNDILNIQMLCPKCNMRKSNKDPIVYMQSIDKLI